MQRRLYVETQYAGGGARPKPVPHTHCWIYQCGIILVDLLFYSLL